MLSPLVWLSLVFPGWITGIANVMAIVIIRLYHLLVAKTLLYYHSSFVLLPGTLILLDDHQVKCC